MPMAIQYAHDILRRLAVIRKEESTMPYLGPDSKSQITLEYENGKPKRIHTIVVSTQHDEGVQQTQIREDIKKYVLRELFDDRWIDNETILHVNPTGSFVIGGPHGDTGLTGRKIIVDTYGGKGGHGGGAFSGKDASKVDRSAAYAARQVAKTIVAAGLADECLVQLAYAIGIAEPVSVMVNSYGTGTVKDEMLAEAVMRIFDLTPAGIIRRLKLKDPIFQRTAAYGHFGREEFAWESLDYVDELRNIIA